ncbi:epidermal growth factor receptor pathway; epiderm al growth factor receptor kinase [Trichuris trichiura]|uniref:Epidermal growth factor receptor pathway epiderm al growth factor receptor kinase n=1 Tax=Trichuris trichiura TaxID=36087 RepID=A0A077YXQ3_TRITR|nr:epidermal growth factor receptor pathway; epiderm al growth factor receptor kinase [Trichuris trichiura]
MPASTVNVATSSHGKMDKSYALEECPSYLVEHLATFGVGPQFGLQWPSDGIRKLKQMERSSAIWAQRMILRLLPTALVVEDENGEAVENFPLDLVSDPTAHLSTDPRDLYNNLLVFVVNEGKNKKSSAPTEMHIFQCVQVSASQLADDIKQYLRGRFKAVPPGRRSGGSGVGGMTTSQVVDGYGHGYSRSYQPRITAENGRMNSSAYRDIDQKSTFSESSVEFFERDVNTLNRCFDDIERFVARIQSAAIAQRELEALQQQRRAMMSKSSKSRQQMQRHPGDGILLLRAQLPTELEFFDILQKFKLCFNLLAKLKNHIHEPNAPELLHFLFTPLAIIVDACQWAFGRSIAPQVVSPLITRAAKALLLNCLTSKESEIWASLGESWRMTADEWRGPPPGSYTPTFADGYVPYYDGGASTLRRSQNLVDMQLSGELNRVSLERERLDLAKERLQEEERRIMHEKRALEQERRRLLEEKRQFYEEQEQRSVISERIARPPPPPPNGVYSSATLSRSRPELYKDMPRDADLRRGVVPDENAQQMSFFEELRFKGAKAAQVTYERPGQNAKELSVRKGEFLEASQACNILFVYAFGNEGFVPHTILTVVDGTPQQQQQQQHRSRSVDEPLFVRAPTGTSTFGPSAGSYPSHAATAELDSTCKANNSPRTPFSPGIAASTNGDTPDAVRQRRGKLESSSSSPDPYASTCSTIRRRLVGLSAPIPCDPPVPPPAPPLPPKLDAQSESAPVFLRKYLMFAMFHKGMLNEELHQTLKQSQIGGILKQKPSSRCPMVKICELSRISTKQDVADWLQAKGFSGRSFIDEQAFFSPHVNMNFVLTCRTVNIMRDYDGEKVLTMTKSQLEEACGRAEGGRLYSQLLLRKSATNFVPKSDDELNNILAARKSATDEACRRPVPESTSFSSDQISPLSDDTGSLVPSDDESFTIAL